MPIVSLSALYFLDRDLAQIWTKHPRKIILMVRGHSHRASSDSSTGLDREA